MLVQSLVTLAEEELQGEGGLDRGTHKQRETEALRFRVFLSSSSDSWAGSTPGLSRPLAPLSMKETGPWCS